MGTRRNAREWALQFLFQSEYNRAASLDEGLALFWKDMDAVEAPPSAAKSATEPADDAKKARLYAEGLIRGVLQHYPQIDERIAMSSDHWRLDRMGVVERNIMRIAVYEMMYRPDIPGAVAINEAITLAKVFSSVESSRFVNGLLDRILRDLQQAAVQQTPPTESAPEPEA